jgi:hypothetical protein
LAQANLEEGHPEWWSNDKLLGESRMTVTQWGPLNLEGEGELEVECDARSFGYITNEGAPAFGRGQILSWRDSGEVNVDGSEVKRACNLREPGVEAPSEAWVTAEPAVEGVRKAPLSVPWNFELLCVEAEGVKSALIRIGIPNGAPPPSAECKSNAARAEEVAGEESRREGCFATTVPEGCIKVNLIAPADGSEFILEGSLQTKYKNGFVNGLHASRWEFEGEGVAGQLHQSGNFARAFHVATQGIQHNHESSYVKNIGFGGLQLIRVR